MRGELPFRNRVEAGRLLGAELGARKLPTNTIVLALPRGGVEIGAEVAELLHAPLDVIVARKIGVPWHRELAMGALAGDTIVLDDGTIRELGVSDGDVQSAILAAREEAERREGLYRGGLPNHDLFGRTVVVVDDGLATGSTMIAAARSIRSRQPQRLIVAVPVAPAEACRRMRKEADECVCLATPEPFIAVGHWYEDFYQVPDREVQRLLRRPGCP